MLFANHKLWSTSVALYSLGVGILFYLVGILHTILRRLLDLPIFRMLLQKMRPNVSWPRVLRVLLQMSTFWSGCYSIWGCYCKLSEVLLNLMQMWGCFCKCPGYLLRVLVVFEGDSDLARVRGCYCNFPLIFWQIVTVIPRSMIFSYDTLKIFINDVFYLLTNIFYILTLFFMRGYWQELQGNDWYWQSLEKRIRIHHYIYNFQLRYIFTAVQDIMTNSHSPPSRP